MKPATTGLHAVDSNNAGVRQETTARANRYDVVSRLADDLAHEIKNPLNAIVVNLEVLRRRMEQGDTKVALERARVIDHEVTRVHGLVDQLLQLIRPGRDEQRVLALDVVLTELAQVLELQAKAARTTFEFAAQNDVFVNASAEAIKFAVLNVVTAFYADADMEHIRVELGTNEAAAIITIVGTPSLRTENNEFVQAARVWLTSVGGTLEIAHGAASLSLPLSNTLA